jgi:hypothetical protein
VKMIKYVMFCCAILINLLVQTVDSIISIGGVGKVAEKPNSDVLKAETRKKGVMETLTKTVQLSAAAGIGAQVMRGEINMMERVHIVLAIR